jgi:hypothetical protein
MPVLAPDPLDQLRGLDDALRELLAVALAERRTKRIDLLHRGPVSAPESAIPVHESIETEKSSRQRASFVARLALTNLERVPVGSAFLTVRE